MQPRAWVKSVTFSDGTKVSLDKNDIVLIVGPNSAGKSAALRGIRDKFRNPVNANPVIQAVEVAREGSVDDLIEWLGATTSRIDQPAGDSLFGTFGRQVHASRARAIWQHFQLEDLAPFFCHLLTAEERLTAANPANNIPITTSAPTHPIHFLQRDDRLEEKLSKQFRRAFGSDLIVHRNAGSQVLLYVGEKPALKSGQDRVSFEFISAIEKLAPVHTEGDGVRSFAGVLLNTAVGSHTVLLIDEPEAFLHPPQARYLGHLLVTDRGAGRQLFVATHSGDVLRGILDADSVSVRVIRLRRSGAANIAHELQNSELAEVWSDPLLRYSNILDGLFHERVVVCESDSDCRFYAAVTDALFETEDGHRKPDLMFTHCGGKHRLALVVEALRRVEVPVSAIADFDVLSTEHPLRDIVEAAGGNWERILDDWRHVRDGIDAKKPERGTDDVRKAIGAVLEDVQDTVFPRSAAKDIQAVLRSSSPWSIAKTIGSLYVPSGRAAQSCERLLKQLRMLGVFVVPVGQLESFCKTVDDHGPNWVNEVLRRNLRDDPELEGARQFVTDLVREQPVADKPY